MLVVMISHRGVSARLLKGRMERMLKHFRHRPSGNRAVIFIPDFNAARIWGNPPFHVLLNLSGTSFRLTQASSR